jgi:hypothetical protein
MPGTLYQSREWKQARNRALGRDKHRCTATVTIAGVTQRCRERRDVHVHHVRAVEDGGDPFHLDNLVTLCDFHHAWAHGNLPDLRSLRDRQAQKRGSKPRQRPNAGAYLLHGGRE